MIDSKTGSWKPPKAERYVVFVDRHAKSDFASEHAAHAEAERISGAFPNVAATQQAAHGDTNDR